MAVDADGGLRTERRERKSNEKKAHW
jgi:hypothetical protein